MKLTNDDLKQIILDADTTSKASHLKTCLKALINWGSAEGWILAKTDTLFSGFNAIGKRKRRIAGESRLYVDKKLIPSHKAVSDVAKYAAEISGVWWYELMFNLAAYSGLRLGEIIDLDINHINLRERKINVETQCLDVGGSLIQTLPKWNTTRITTYPKVTPEDYDLAENLKKRINELKKIQDIPEIQDGSKRLLLFPNSEGGWLGASTFGTRVRRPAQAKANWPKDSNKKYLWNFHSLRHVFCSYYYGDLKKDIRDVAIAAGHRSPSTTMEMYVGNVAGAIERLRD
jgi:integrase